MNSTSDLEWALPSFNGSSLMEKAEEVLSYLLFSCSDKVSPSSASKLLHSISPWASKEVGDEMFRILFDIDRTFGNFCAMWFKMDKIYHVPVLWKLEIDPKFKEGLFEDGVLEILLALIQKISLTLIALDCVKGERTGRPIEHMLPTNMSETKRCKSLYDVILCVWTRMCHVWGNTQDHNDTFLCKELSCFSIDGQTRTNYLWIDVNPQKHKCRLKANTCNVDLVRNIRIYTWPDGNWFTFSTKTNLEVYSTEDSKNLPFLTLVFLGDGGAADASFKITPGTSNDLECFVLVTRNKGLFHGFYEMKGQNIVSYPLLFHPMLKDMFGMTPRDERATLVPLNLCVMCGYNTETYIIDSVGVVFCSETCLLESQKITTIGRSQIK